MTPFKGRFLGPSLTDANCLCDICLGIICPGDMSISGISQLLLTRYWQNFKGRCLGPSLTDANCHRDICSKNICSDEICRNVGISQLLLTQFWPKFLGQNLFGDLFFPAQNLFLPKLFWTQNFCWPFLQATFVLATFVHIRNISAVSDLILTKL